MANAQKDLAVALVTQGKTDEAVAHLTKVLEQDPSQAEMQFELANLLVATTNLPRPCGIIPKP